uniref:Fe-S cluster assembly protein SufB n=1 Tax=Lachnospira eligens TaxID=39485 RepID=UPI003FF0AA80
MEEKTFVDDINRSVYDIKNEENDSYRIKQGLTPEIVEKISEEKHDPAWMREFRLKSLEIYNNMQVPDWGPSIDGLNMDNIATYVRANTNMKGDWNDVPEEIKDTFDRLGIPKAERESLAGVGAQYDSELVYHNVRKEVADQGVVYTDMESALTGEYADMVHEHFMKLITPQDHKFAALHGAVWSGGSFVYVPKGVNLEIPLQSYFRLNAAGAGQFEHTLIIVDEGASLHFIEEYDSELVYHNVRKEVADQGVVYTDMESALTGEYADMVHEHFMKLITPQDHKFAALHGAVWSGGSFVYVPKGVNLEIPLQSYFRLNAAGAGQFEHTLIIVDEGASLHFIEGCSAPKYNVANLHAGAVELFVAKNAKLRYSTIENWSKNMYNLNTKRATVAEGGKIEWVSGSFGSHVSYLYPMSILNGERSSCEFTGITFAGAGQNLDTGMKVVHNAPGTTSVVSTKSISKGGGISTFRSAVTMTTKAKKSKSSVSCQSLMIDDISRSDTIPAMDIRVNDADVGHEATIGRISDDAVFYLMSRGIPEDDARAMIVSGFADNVSKELPLEYAMEMNNLIRLEMKGSIG